MDLIRSPGIVPVVLGFFLVLLSGLFREEGRYYEGTGKPTGNYKLNGKFDDSGNFQGDVTPEYNNGGYTQGRKNLIGEILMGIGVGLIVWTCAWWVLQFVNCFSCFFSTDINAMSENDDKVAILAFIVGIIGGIIGFNDAN
jgi:hypothetical protein